MENKRGNVLIVFLVIAIILIVVMGALLYMQKTESDKQIAELENNAGKLQETINDLQGKMDGVSNIVNSNNIIKIEGEYHLVQNENSEGLTYKFEGNKVTFGALYVTKGTYEIEDKKIKITYSEAYDVDGNSMEYPNGQYEELTIVDENTLTSQRIRDGVVYTGKYVKNITSSGNSSDSKYSEITKKLESEEIFLLTDTIKNNDGTYTLKGKIITEDTSKEPIAEYPFYKETGEYRQITLSSNTKCQYVLESEDEYKTDTVENVFSKKLYAGLGQGPCFNFTFENGKCISVNEIITGH